MIKLVNLLSIFTFIILGTVSQAEEDDKERSRFTKIKEAFSEVFDDVKEIHEIGGLKLAPLPKEPYSNSSICVSCNDISDLVKEVNKTLQVLAKQENDINSLNRTIEEVSGLDALYHYTYDENALVETDKCNRYQDSEFKVGKDDLDIDNSVVFFSKEIPIEKINSLHIRDGKKRTYFYRGQEPDRDLLIRLDIHSDKKAKVTYYKIDGIPLKKSSNIATVDNSNKLELWGTSANKDGNKNNYLDYGAGLSVEHSSFIPQKLTLIKGRSLTSLSDSLAFKTSAEVSSEKQVAAVALSSGKGRDYVKLELDPEMAELKIPTQLSLTSKGLKLLTEYSVNTEDQHKLTFGLSGEKGAKTSLMLERDELGVHSASFLRTKKLTKNQTFTIQLKGDEEGSNGAWLRYKLVF